MTRVSKITGISIILSIVIIMVSPNLNAIHAYFQLQSGYWQVFSYDFTKGEYTKPFKANKMTLNGEVTSFHFRNDTLFSPNDDYLRISWGNRLKTPWGSFKIIDVKKDTIVYAIFSRPYIIKDTIDREIKTDVPNAWEVLYMTKMKNPILHELPSEIETYIGY